MATCFSNQTTPINYVITACKPSLGQGNAFTPVYDSVHRGVSVPAYITDHITGGSLSRGSLSRRRRPPQTEIPPSPQGNERPVRILPECILVMILYLYTETVTISPGGLTNPLNLLFERQETVHGHGVYECRLSGADIQTLSAQQWWIYGHPSRPLSVQFYFIFM